MGLWVEATEIWEMVRRERASAATLRWTGKFRKETWNSVRRGDVACGKRKG
jgi:hypothetical protein